MKVFLNLLLTFIGGLVFSQQTEYVDFIHAEVNVVVSPGTKSILGLAIYDFDLLGDADSICVDAQNMVINKVVLNDEEMAFDYNGKRIKLSKHFKKSEKNKLKISYEAVPKKALYFVGWKNEAPNQVWTQGQGKYTSNWLPSFDDVNEKVEFDLNITADEGYEVIANGVLLGSTSKDSKKTWHYDMTHPMSSYLLAFAIGKYDRKLDYSKSGIPLEMYYYPEDSLKVEPTYRYTRQIFDFFEKEIGFPYPWQTYKQIPAHDFLYAGMENTSATIFDDSYVVDEIGFNDRNYVNVNAHELAHQWFGDLVTAKSGEHHWLQEGFATFYALLAEKQAFGDNYYYWRLLEYAEELKDQDRSGTGTSLLNPKSSSLTFYKRGAWVLHALRELVGDEIFRIAVKNYLNKFQFQNVETSDFISEVEAVDDMDLTQFVNVWIKSAEFPYEKAKELLMRSTFIQEYEMVDCEADNSKCSYYLNSYVSDEAKIKIIKQKPQLITSETFKNSIPVRRALAEVMTTIPMDLREDYETLLDDKSYYTKETALYNLWVNFPQRRKVYLDKMATVNGLNYNVKLLWLALALNTFEYDKYDKESLMRQLIDFTSPKHNVEVRMNAFQFAFMLNACNDACLGHLKEARTHHNWRMAKFAKEQLQKVNPGN